MLLIDEKIIEEIAIGAAVLGTGGGGDPYLGKLIAQQAIREFGPITLLSPEEVDDDAFCISSSGMGAPTVMIEKLPSHDEYLIPFRALEKFMNKKADIIYPVECGGINSMIPFIVSAQTKIPVADIDGMGRAFPELQMVTFHLYGHSITPLAMGDCRSNSVIMNTVGNYWTESFARAVTVQMGGQAAMADTPLTGKQLKEAGIHNPIALSRKIGATILQSSQNNLSPTEAILEISGGYDLFYGKVVDIIRNTDGAFVRGKAILEGIGRDKGRRLEMQDRKSVV